jgi:hypothetical protein
MIKTVSAQAGQIFTAYSNAMAQAAYLRRHGHLHDRTVARLADLAAAAAAANQGSGKAASDSAAALPGLEGFAQ